MAVFPLVTIMRVLRCFTQSSGTGNITSLSRILLFRSFYKHLAAVFSSKPKPPEKEIRGWSFTHSFPFSEGLFVSFFRLPVFGFVWKNLPFYPNHQSTALWSLNESNYADTAIIILQFLYVSIASGDSERSLRSNYIQSLHDKLCDGNRLGAIFSVPHLRSRVWLQYGFWLVSLDGDDVQDVPESSEDSDLCVVVVGAGCRHDETHNE